jgi:hypothetical protein
MVRHSQFILTYGPGAILESKEGPRLIPLPEIGLFHARSGLNPDNFRVTDPRLRKILKEGEAFRLPSNAELGKSEMEPLYLTRVFPSWWICQKHGVIFRYGDGCPKCMERNEKNWDAMRFVLACSAGHLDDVDWDYAVHMDHRGRCSSGEYPRYYLWKGGASLRDIEITCPNCKASVTMQRIYVTHWICRGRFPEKEPLDSGPVRNRCDRKSYVVLRQASYLRVPCIISLFTIPPIYTRLHQKMEELRELHGALALKRPQSMDEFSELLDVLAQRKVISESDVGELLSYDWETVKSAIQDLLDRERSWEDQEESGWDDILNEEFESLRKASKEGAPPYKIKSDASKIIFHVPKEGIQKVAGPSGHDFTVAPITKLRVVLVQKGYYRMIPGGDPKLIDVGCDIDGKRWYPAVEYMGEGLFITSENIMLEKPRGECWDAWLDAYNNRRGEYKGYLFRDERSRKELHPAFVWWHTLSHLLIRALSINSGYSAASIRERVYLTLGRDGKAEGGIVLYTTQPGEGTMGGLVSLASRFDEVLERVAELAEVCPNDPLCIDQKFGLGKVYGAACYACSFVSETSCEHRNMWLDRALLLEVPP